MAVALASADQIRWPTGACPAALDRRVSSPVARARLGKDVRQGTTTSIDDCVGSRVNGIVDFLEQDVGGSS